MSAGPGALASSTSPCLPGRIASTCPLAPPVGTNSRPRPVTGRGLMFVPTGFASGQVLAIRPGKQGEVLDAKAPGPADMQLQVVWKTKKNAPKKPSLLLLGDLLYALEDNGVATCW